MKRKNIGKYIVAPLLVSSLFIASTPVIIDLKYTFSTKDKNRTNTIRFHKENKVNKNILDTIINSFNLSGRVFAECIFNSTPSTETCDPPTPSNICVKEGTTTNQSFDITGGSTDSYYPVSANFNSTDPAVTINPVSRSFNNYAGNSSDPAPDSLNVVYNYQATSPSVSVADDPGDASGPYSGLGRKEFTLQVSNDTYVNYTAGSWYPSSSTTNTGVSGSATLFVDHVNQAPILATATPTSTTTTATSLNVTAQFNDTESNTLNYVFELSTDNFSTILQSQTYSGLAAGSSQAHTFTGLTVGTYKWRARAVETNALGTCASFPNEESGVNLTTTSSSYIIQVNSPGTPVTSNLGLISPINGEIVQTLRPTLKWSYSNISNLANFNIYLDGNLLDTVSSSTTEYTLKKDLAGLHTWNINAVDSNSTVLLSSDEGAFNIGSVQYSFTLISPIQSAVVNTTSPKLIWEASKDKLLSFYEIYLDGKYLGKTDNGTTEYQLKNISEGLHKWQVVTFRRGLSVRGKVSGVRSGNSNEEFFSVSVTPVATPVVKQNYSLNLTAKAEYINLSKKLTLNGKLVSGILPENSFYRLNILNDKNFTVYSNSGSVLGASTALNSNESTDQKRLQEDTNVSISVLNIPQGVVDKMLDNLNYKAILQAVQKDGQILTEASQTFKFTPLPTPTPVSISKIPQKVCTYETENIFCDHSLAEISSFVIPPELKEAGVVTQILANFVTLGVLLSPAAMGLNTRNLFLSGILLITGRRSKKTWGIVYDEQSRKPVPFAAISLVDATTNKFIKDTVTDTDGRFAFAVDKGKYWLIVKAQGYNVTLTNNNLFSSDIYNGEIIDVNSSDVAFGVKIPIQNENTKSHKLLNNFKINLPNIFRVLAVVMLIISIFMFYISSSIMNLVSIFVYLILTIYVFYNKSIVTKSLGFVYEVLSNQRIKSAFVKLLDKNAKELVQDLVLTDEKGRFILMTDPGDYNLMIESENYQVSKVNKGMIVPPSSVNLYFDDKNRIEVGMEKTTPKAIL